MRCTGGRGAALIVLGLTLTSSTARADRLDVALPAGWSVTHGDGVDLLRLRRGATDVGASLYVGVFACWQPLVVTPDQVTAWEPTWLPAGWLGARLGGDVAAACWKVPTGRRVVVKLLASQADAASSDIVALLDALKAAASAPATDDGDDDDDDDDDDVDDVDDSDVDGDTDPATDTPPAIATDAAIAPATTGDTVADVTTVTDTAPIPAPTPHAARKPLLPVPLRVGLATVGTDAARGWGVRVGARLVRALDFQESTSAALVGEVGWDDQTGIAHDVHVELSLGVGAGLSLVGAGGHDAWGDGTSAEVRGAWYGGVGARWRSQSVRPFMIELARLWRGADAPVAGAADQGAEWRFSGGVAMWRRTLRGVSVELRDVGATTTIVVGAVLAL